VDGGAGHVGVLGAMVQCVSALALYGIMTWRCSDIEGLVPLRPPPAPPAKSEGREELGDGVWGDAPAGEGGALGLFLGGTVRPGIW